VIRLDGAGDVVLAEPVVRAVSARAAWTVVVCGPAGAGAATLLGADEICVIDAPWVPLEPRPAGPAELEAIVDGLRRAGLDRAVVLTSFHQSPLPMATMLKLAGVAQVAGLSVDHPGSQHDVRCREAHGHQVQANATVAGAAGYPVEDLTPRVVAPALPAWLERLASRQPVVVHPGASVAARGVPLELARHTVRALAEHHLAVALTGSAEQTTALRDLVDDDMVYDLGGATTWRDLAALVACARAVLCGNTGVGHLAAALDTPVVSIFAPTVDPASWRPWGQRVAVLGDHNVCCAGCRARRCPWGEPVCLSSVRADDVLGALDHLGVRLGAGAVTTMAASS
jgi:ADP-heptose:LPS heptosyltransferase